MSVDMTLTTPAMTTPATSAFPRRGGRFAAFFALLATFLLASAPEPAFAMKIQVVKSPGGIEAWLVEAHSNPLLALKFSFEGGSAQDPAGKEGVANFITAMLDEGAGDLESSAFQERMEEIAMRMSYEDSRDAFYGNFETLSQNREEAVKLLRLAITKPRFDKDAVDRIRQQLIANLAYAERDPNKVAMKNWYQTAFAGHPYGRDPAGTEATLASITRDDLEAYRKRVFAKDKLHIVAVGDITAEELGKLVDDVFGDLPAKSELTPIPMAKVVAGGKETWVSMEVPQSVAVFGVGAMLRKDPDFLTAFIVNQLLGGGGFDSRLMEEVREKRGLAYSAYSYLQPYKQAGLLAGGVATRADAITQSIDIIREELKKLAKDGPTAEELENTKKYLIGSYALRFDTNSKIASQLLGLYEDDFGPDYVEKRNALVEAVTIEDAKRVAKRMFDTDDLIVTVVGPPQASAVKADDKKG